MNYKPKLVSDNNDMVHEIDAQTKTMLIELTSDGKIVFYVDGLKVDAKQYLEQHKASIDFHKIMDFIQQTLDRAPNIRERRQ
tara:strand:+ start:1735 stop:1980 length:246 start_codon:yes stop_codon:yes gene_type:complete